MQGFFDAPTEDVYQFQLWHYGDLKLTVDSTLLYHGQQGDYTERFVPVNLAAGRHRLTLSGTTGVESRLRVLFGGHGTASIGSEKFRHPPKK